VSSFPTLYQAILLAYTRFLLSLETAQASNQFYVLRLLAFLANREQLTIQCVFFILNQCGSHFTSGCIPKCELELFQLTFKLFFDINYGRNKLPQY